MRRIGLDFDNTMICYDSVFLSAAKERGLAPPDFVGSKQQIRDAIRLRPGGEAAWQQLQGYVYGRGLDRAEAFEGLGAFLRRARGAGDAVVVISHKTEFGHLDPERINLRQAALAWMKAEGLLEADGPAGLVGAVFFEGTRAEKLRRIASTRCDIFVDDLEEVLADPDFPPGVERILFSHRPSGAIAAPHKVCASWASIEETLFA
jgi:hypothetical protein